MTFRIEFRMLWFMNTQTTDTAEALPQTISDAAWRSVLPFLKAFPNIYVGFLNIATGKHVDAKEANFHDFHESITYSSDGSTFATAEQQGIYLRDESIMYSPDGSTFATAEQQGIYLRDTVTGKHKTTLATDTYIDYDEIPFTEYGPDGCTIASLVSNVHSDAGRMYLWEVTTGERKISEYIGRGPFEYSPDGKTIVSITEFDEFDYSPDGVVAVVGTTTENGDIYLWDTATGKQKALLYNKYKTPFRGDSIRFRYSPDGRTNCCYEF